MIAAAFDAAASKQTAYQEGLTATHTMTQASASTLCLGSTLETTLVSLAKENVLDSKTVEVFLHEQRERVKKVAEKNVGIQRELATFVAAAKALRQAELENPTTDFADYTPKVQQKMQEIRAKNAYSQLEITQEKLYLDVCHEMGEAQPSSKTNVDDDIELMPAAAGTQSTNFKCPVTGSFMEEPMKNKVCGHVYSKGGIVHAIQQAGVKRRPCRCPVPGCANSHVTMQQLEKDPHTERLVRREKQRLQRESQKRASQADLVDSEEEEEF